MVIQAPKHERAKEPSKHDLDQGQGKQNFTEQDLEGFKYFDLLLPLLEELHEAGTERDRAGNRELFYDQYGSLILLYFFNPVVTSLRGIQHASGFRKVQRILKVSRSSLGSLSEAARVFDSELLHPIISQLAGRLQPVYGGREAEALKNLTAVDGSLLPALPKMAW